MANGLTDSDMNRFRLGFGVSGDTESRRRAAAAGIAPLTTTERIRKEWGWGPTSSPASQRAFQAAEVIERGGSIAEMPEQYGGRPTGTTRRAIRMQEEWDKQREAMLQEQRVAQQMDLEQRRFALTERDQILQERQEARLQAAEAKAQEEILKVSEQADSALNEVLGGFDSTGNPISGLDPDAPDYMQRRNDIIKRYPKAMKDEAFKTAISTTDKSYFDKINFDQQLQAQEESSGRIIERQVAAEERAAEKQRGIREEERKAQEERDITSKEREINKIIRQERQKLIQFQNQRVKPKEDIQATQNKLIDLEMEKADLRGLVFDDNEAYQKAKEAGTAPPAGTIIYVGRKRVKVK